MFQMEKLSKILLILCVVFIAIGIIWMIRQTP